MQRALARVVAVAIGVFTLAVNSVDAADERDRLREAQEERAAVEAQLSILLREIPADFEIAAVEEKLRKRAAAADLARAVVAVDPSPTPLPIESAQPSPVLVHRVSVSGRAPYQSVDRFLEILHIAMPDVRIGKVSIEAVRGGSVQFDVGLHLLSFDSIPETVPRGDLVAAIRERTALLRSIVTALTDFLDPHRKDVFGALANATRELDAHPVAFTRVSSDGEELAIDGVLAGSATRLALLEALEKARFTVARQSFSSAGPCRAFTLALRLDDDASERGVVLDNGIFDADAAALCVPEPAGPSPSPIVVRGAATAAGEGRKALRFPDLDAADLFFVINDLLPENFVIGSDVKGRVSLDALEGVTVEETMAAIAASGLRVGPGPLRLVSRSNEATAPARESEAGEAVSFMMKEADVSQLLCIIEGIGGPAIQVPRGLRERVSVFAIDIGVNHLRDGIVAAAGLSTTKRGNRLLVGPQGARAADYVSACESFGAESVASLPSRIHPARLGAEDLALAGVARIGDSWRGYVYTPARRLLPIDPGAQFIDAIVKSVGPDGVTFATEGGAVVELRFP